MIYHHVTEVERYQIAAYLTAGWTQKAIARKLARSPSTISRELRRNRGLRGYRPAQANRLYERRQDRCAANAPCISVGDWHRIEALLRQEWSPEQIAGRTRLASTESIYQHVYRDKASAGTLWRHLRCQKQRRKRYGSGRSKRGLIPNRRPLSERPKAVDQRRRLGDWEGDTVIGKGHQGALVTLAERRSQLIRLRRVECRQAEAVSKAMIRMLRPLSRVSSTITLDNGKEFALHEVVERKTRVKVYFADPYSSWQRGLNEQINGLVRQYVPKGCSMKSLSAQDIAMIEKRINNRPRKSLGYRTPLEVFNQMASAKGVALRY